MSEKKHPMITDDESYWDRMVCRSMNLLQSEQGTLWSKGCKIQNKKKIKLYLNDLINEETITIIMFQLFEKCPKVNCIGS